MRIPGTLRTIWLVSPWPMKPAPMLATRIGRPSASLAFSALSTMIMKSILLHSDGKTHTLLHFGFLSVQQRIYLILVGDHAHRQRPLESQAGIVVQQTAFEARSVELAHLIAGFGLVLEGLISMREAFRHIQGAIIVLVQLDGNMLEVGRAFRAKVDDDVENRAALATQE